MRSISSRLKVPPFGHPAPACRRCLAFSRPFLERVSVIIGTARRRISGTAPGVDRSNSTSKYLYKYHTCTYAPKGCPHDHRQRPSTETSTDFRDARRPSPPPPEEVARRAAARPRASAHWWGPTTGSARRGRHVRGRLRQPQAGSSSSLHVGRARRAVEWRVEQTPLTPEWAGTTIVFDLEPVGRRIRAALPPPRAHPAARVLRHVPRRAGRTTWPAWSPMSTPARASPAATDGLIATAEADRAPRRCEPREWRP